MSTPTNPHIVLVIDLKSQYTLLIANQIRQKGVRTEVIPFSELEQLISSQSPSTSSSQLLIYKSLFEVRGVVFSGGPSSVNTITRTQMNRYKSVYQRLNQTNPPIAIMGICLGSQIIAHLEGAIVTQSTDAREYGSTKLQYPHPTDSILKFVNLFEEVWMSHSDSIKSHSKLLPIARTVWGALAAYRVQDHPTIIGLQFHPEVSHTKSGHQLFDNWLTEANINRDWTDSCIISDAVNLIQQNVPENEHVLVACSGGVDSTIVAMMVQLAIGSRMRGVLVDTGLLRKGEYDEVLKTFCELEIHVEGVKAGPRFLKALQNVSEPEKKRKIIGSTFIDVFQEYTKNHPEITTLAQGTIYPDVIESQGGIKSHHNVGGLPDHLHLKLLEPVRYLFKDDIRRIGTKLYEQFYQSKHPDAHLYIPTPFPQHRQDILNQFLHRHPFPGPGLAIRITGAISPEKVQILQEADAIFYEQLSTHNLLHRPWQWATILLGDTKTVGVQGDVRTYGHVIALRLVDSVNGMTASPTDVPLKFLTDTATQIINRTPYVNRVVYDVTSKPPGTIEWE